MSIRPETFSAGIGSPAYLPQTADGLTPDWLTAQLRGIGAIRGARVTSVTTAPVGEFGMSGDIYRLLLAYDSKESGAPTSLVAKIATADPELRAILHAMGVYEREAHFYTDLAAHTPVRAPRCYLASVDVSSGASLLLLEDLSSLPALGWQPRATAVEASAVLRELASLHATWWANDRLKTLSWLALRGLAANDQVQSVFGHYWDDFLAKLSVPITQDISDLGHYGVRYLAPVVAHLHDSAPITLIHNDVQGANILFDRAQQSAILLDWQLTTIGRGAVDVAYFLGGCLRPGDRRASWDGLVRAYHQLLVERGVVDYSLQQCQVDCRLALLPSAARIATAVGAHPGLRRDPGGYWNDILPRYASALQELNVPDLCADLFD